jgi:DNA-binding response OmpR family regulator
MATSIKIAVIEDEGFVLRSVTWMLEKEGFEVAGYVDAAPALAECQFEEVDLILTDLVMPTRGEQLIQEVRSRGINTPIIAMSANLTNAANTSLAALGAQAVLQKPFEIDELVNLVNSLAKPA